jgi:ubiquinone/menaquinone biosynthesis C-methylase UbiE
MEKNKERQAKLEAFWNEAYQGEKPYKLEKDSLKDNALSQEMDLLAANGGKVLDLGCGEGSLLNEAALKSDGRISGLGIDASANAISLAEASALLSGVKNCLFQVGKLADIRKMPSSSFEAVICSNFLDVIPFDESLLFAEEIQRLLKKGGYLVFKVNFLIDEAILARTNGTREADGSVCIDGILRSNDRSDETWIKAFSKLALLRREEYQRNPKGPADRLFVFQKK